MRKRKFFEYALKGAQACLDEASEEEKNNIKHDIYMIKEQLAKTRRSKKKPKKYAYNTIMSYFSKPFICDLLTTYNKHPLTYYQAITKAQLVKTYIDDINKCLAEEDFL